MIPPAIEFLIVIFAIFLVSRDISNKDLEKKYILKWMFTFIISVFLFTAYGALIVVVIYFVWSRFFYLKKKKLEKKKEYLQQLRK